MDGLHIWSNVENENSESENGKSESSLSKKNLLMDGRHLFPNVHLAKSAVDVIYIVAHIVLK